jgi:hypothetical protein
MLKFVSFVPFFLLLFAVWMVPAIVSVGYLIRKCSPKNSPLIGVSTQPFRRRKHVPVARDRRAKNLRVVIT